MTETKTILLVDDDVDFVVANTALLEAEGYTVVSAGETDSGIKMALENKPDVMVIDVMMEYDTEGFDLSRKIQETPELKGTPVIMLTGMRKAMNIPFKFEPDENWLPVQAILEKPVSPETFLAEIKKALDN